VAPYPVAAWCGGGDSVENLRIPLSGVPEEGFAVDAAFSVESIRPEASETVSAESLSVTGLLTRVGTIFLFRGRLKGALVHLCDRCLEESSRPFDAELFWSFVEGKADADIGAAGLDEADGDPSRNEERTFQGHTIDLGPHVWEEIVFAVPVKHLCRDECLGLCPSCGANLNHGSCKCPSREEESSSEPKQGLAGLAEMFPDLAPKKEKE